MQRLSHAHSRSSPQSAAPLTTNGPCDFAFVALALKLSSGSFCTHPPLIHSSHTYTPSTRLSDYKTSRQPPFRPVQPVRRQIWRSFCFKPPFTFTHLQLDYQSNMAAALSPLTDALPPEIRIRIYKEVLRADRPLRIARKKYPEEVRYVSSYLRLPRL